jgi:hypothetical protein
MHNANATHIHAPPRMQASRPGKERLLTQKLLVLGLRRARCQSVGQIPQAKGNFAEKATCLPHTIRNMRRKE